MTGSRWEVKVEVKRQAIVDAARETVGWPFRHRGRNKNGIDCIGLLLYVSERTGLLENMNLPNYYTGLNYDRRPATKGIDSQWLMRELSITGKRIQKSSVQMGDIVYCRNDKWVHVGIVTPEKMIHAYAFPHRRVIEHGYDKVWKRATIAAFSWPGVVF
jgi:cell wall-associated NlpC family hydrolase